MKKQLLLLIMMVLPMVAWADASGTCGATLTWTYSEATKTLTIEGTGDMANYSSSSSIPWSSYWSVIEKIIIGDGVTSIGSYAFWYCSSLTSITIPNSVTSIGIYAFSGCTGLTSITIPNGVTSIGNVAFSGCRGLTSVTIGDGVTSIGERAFYGCSGLTSVTIGDGVTSIGERAFYGCSGLTSITIPNSVTSIGNYAFSGCTGLTSITIPNSVTSIEVNAFSGCTSLSSIVVDKDNSKYDSRDNCNAVIKTATNTLLLGCRGTIIPNSVTSIGTSAFSGCTGLTSITIPNSVTSIGTSAFSGCTGLSSIVVDKDNSTYDSRDNCNAVIITATNTLLLGCRGTIIPNSVTSIGEYAFSGCTGLTSITIPNSVTSIGNFAFRNCSGLTSVTIPNSVTSIEQGAFYGCTGLTSITIPNSVTSIGQSAFSDCTGLTSVTIPNSVTSIGVRAFYGCRLVNVLVKNVEAASSGAFSDRTYQHAMLYIPDGTWVKAIYDYDWYLFNHIKEVVTDDKSLMKTVAYNLMDTKTFGYMVYDPSSNSVKNVEAFYKMDEGDPNNCWQVVENDLGTCLYNIGARKYASILSDGSIALSEYPVASVISTKGDGIVLGGNPSNWSFVKDTSVEADKNLSGIGVVTLEQTEGNSYYSLDGKQVNQPKKGINIMKKGGKTVKVVY